MRSNYFLSTSYQYNFNQSIFFLNDDNISMHHTSHLYHQTRRIDIFRNSVYVHLRPIGTYRNYVHSLCIRIQMFNPVFGKYFLTEIIYYVTWQNGISRWSLYYIYIILLLLLLLYAQLFEPVESCDVHGHYNNIYLRHFYLLRVRVSMSAGHSAIYIKTTVNFSINVVL